MQIADKIRQQIASGDLSAGSALPSEKVLAAEFQVTRQTVRRAVRLLKEEGVVYSSQGRGTFVGPEGAPQAPRRVPRYQQIANELIAQIKAGDYQPNRPIPSESTLVQRFEVAPGTVRQALAYLREQRWVFTVPQKATYVNTRDEWPAD
jgi:DNA-binding GntR family transcriptional regulator